METMTTSEQPVTRSELREELDRLRDEFKSYYATKADLAQLEMRLTIRLTGVMVTLGGVIIAVLRFWQ